MPHVAVDTVVRIKKETTFLTSFAYLHKNNNDLKSQFSYPIEQIFNLIIIIHKYNNNLLLL